MSDLTPILENISSPQPENTCPFQCKLTAAIQCRKAFPHSRVYDYQVADSYPYTFYCRIHKADFDLWIQRQHPHTVAVND